MVPSLAYFVERTTSTTGILVYRIVLYNPVVFQFAQTYCMYNTGVF